MEDYIRKNEAGIYIHIPFCKKKCLYCNFYSLETGCKNYGEWIIKELELYDKDLAHYVFKTLYIGGGTPSILPLDQIEFLMQGLQKYNLIKSLTEKTIEANPDSLTKDKCRAYLNLGFNRISLGIQSFNEEILKKLGRLSDSIQNQTAVGFAQSYFNNFSLDLIYGIPGQNLRDDLTRVLATGAPHISAYCLTIEEGTPLYSNKKHFALPDDRLSRQFLEVHEFLEKNGYQHYEISNFCKPGFESRHNLNYWNRGFYLGLGAGASGFLGNVRYQNEELENYQGKILAGQRPTANLEILERKDYLIEAWMLGMRKKSGITLAEIELYLTPEDRVWFMEELQNFCQQGWVQVKNQRVTPTLNGWLFLNTMEKNLYAHL